MRRARGAVERTDAEAKAKFEWTRAPRADRAILGGKRAIMAVWELNKVVGIQLRLVDVLAERTSKRVRR